MTDKELELIRELAAKLGTTVEHLWGVLVAQASVTGIVAAVQLVGLCLVAVAAFVLFRTAWGASAGHSEEDWRAAEKRQYVLIACTVLGALLAFVTLIGVAFEAPTMLRTVITAFNNPEYLALQEILRAVK